MKTVTVRRANVVLQVEEDNVDKYIADGYSVIDENGNVIKKSAPQTIQDYQDIIADLQRQLALANKEIEVLKQISSKSESVKQKADVVKKKSTKTAKAE